MLPNFPRKCFEPYRLLIFWLKKDKMLSNFLDRLLTLIDFSFCVWKFGAQEGRNAAHFPDEFVRLINFWFWVWKFGAQEGRNAAQFIQWNFEAYRLFILGLNLEEMMIGFLQKVFGGLTLFFLQDIRLKKGEMLPNFSQWIFEAHRLSILSSEVWGWRRTKCCPICCPIFPMKFWGLSTVRLGGSTRRKCWSAAPKKNGT